MPTRPKRLDLTPRRASRFAATHAACLATRALNRLGNFGPGRGIDGALLVETALLMDAFTLCDPQPSGWGFARAVDGTGLLLRSVGRGFSAVAPIALAPDHPDAHRHTDFTDWVELADALPPCGLEEGWVFPWFEAFEPEARTTAAWNRWCRGWLIHWADTCDPQPAARDAAYLAVQSARVDHTGHLTPPRVVAHPALHRGILDAMESQIATLVDRMDLPDMLHQSTPGASIAQLLGTSQRCPDPTSAHGRMALLEEALHSPLNTTMSGGKP